MRLAKVLGSVVATIKVEGLEGEKLLLIQPIDEDGVDIGTPIVSVDAAQAGSGDLVYWVMSREASLALANPFVPVDAAVVGIVDQVNKVDLGIVNKEQIFINKTP